jgi:hypothetical protein
VAKSQLKNDDNFLGGLVFLTLICTVCLVQLAGRTSLVTGYQVQTETLLKYVADTYKNHDLGGLVGPDFPVLGLDLRVKLRVRQFRQTYLLASGESASAPLGLLSGHHSVPSDEGMAVSVQNIVEISQLRQC